MKATRKKKPARKAPSRTAVAPTAQLRKPIALAFHPAGEMAWAICDDGTMWRVMLGSLEWTNVDDTGMTDIPVALSQPLPAQGPTK